MYAFEIERPESVDAALAALADDEAQPLSGGQTLIPTLKQRLAMPSKLVSLMHVADLAFIRDDDQGRICIGGATTHARIARELADRYPALAYLASRIGDPAVRARGTIGGSLANNDPSACWPAGALASGATIVVQGQGGRREIAADDYFRGMFETALDDGEIVVEVKFPVPQSAAYEKFIQPASRFPLVAAFVARFADGVRVAVTGASNNGVFRHGGAEAALGTDFAKDAVADIATDPGDMIGDLHGTPEYRAHLVRVLIGRAVANAS